MHFLYLAAILTAILDFNKAKLGWTVHPLVSGTRQYVLAKNAKNDFRAILQDLEAEPLDYYVCGSILT